MGETVETPKPKRPKGGHPRKTKSNRVSQKGFTKGKAGGGPAAHKAAVRNMRREREIVARQNKAWELLLAGATFNQIAAKLKISNYTAWTDCQKARERMHREAGVDAATMVDRQAGRMQRLYLEEELKPGKKDPMARLAILQHEAKLFGLYPQKRDYSQEQVVALLRGMSAVFAEALMAVQNAHGLSAAVTDELRRRFALGMRQRTGSVAIEAKSEDVAVVDTKEQET